MGDTNKSKKHLVEDIKELRTRIQELEKSDIKDEEVDNVIMPQDLLQTIPDIVYKVDTKGRFTYLNEAISILGYEPADLLGKKFDIIIHPDDIKKVSRELVLPKYKGKTTGEKNAPKLFDERRTGRRRTRNLEIRFIHKTAREFTEDDILTGMLFSYGELSSSGHYRASGSGAKKYVGSIGVIHDITPWKHTEIELRQSERKYRRLLESISDGIVQTDSDYNIIYINKATEDLFKWSLDEIKGKKPDVFFADPANEHFKEIYGTVSSGKVYYNDAIRSKDKNGRSFLCQLKVSPLFNDNDNIAGYVGIQRDITSFRKAEEHLEESETRYKALVEDMPALICRFKKDSTLTFANSPYCDYFGRKAEDLIGKKWLQLVPEKEREKLKNHFQQLTKEHPMVTYEHKVIGAEGSIMWHRWTDRVLFDEKGRVREYQSIGFDITERRKSEETLRESEESLHEKNIQLYEKNIAIREMMNQVKLEKERTEQKIMDNVDQLLLPFLTRLQQPGTSIKKKHIQIIENNLKKLLSSFGGKITSKKYKLTKRELEICNLIKNGLTSKEIARMLYISERTVENHRTTIRKKLEINNKQINMQTFLHGLSS